MLGNCNKCPGLLKFKPDNDSTQIVWKRWVENEKVEIGGSVLDLYDQLSNDIPDFLVHTLVKRRQSNLFDQRKSDSSEEHMVVQYRFC